MKDNSCLYRAVSAVVSYQFGVQIDSQVFDRYNDGRGIPVENVSLATNEALRPYGLCVSAVYANVVGEFAEPWLLQEPTFVPAPCVVMVDNGHAKPCFPDQLVSGVLAMTIDKM